MNFDTIAVHGNYRADRATGAITPPIYQTTTYVLDEVGKTKGFDYSRSSNPTRQVLEEASRGRGRGLCRGVRLRPLRRGRRVPPAQGGDHVVASEDMYGGVTRLMEQVFKPFGLEVHLRGHDRRGRRGSRRAARDEDAVGGDPVQPQPPHHRSGGDG